MLPDCALLDSLTDFEDFLDDLLPTASLLSESAEGNLLDVSFWTEDVCFVEVAVCADTAGWTADVRFVDVVVCADTAGWGRRLPSFSVFPSEANESWYRETCELRPPLAKTMLGSNRFSFIGGPACTGEREPTWNKTHSRNTEFMADAWEDHPLFSSSTEVPEAFRDMLPSAPVRRSRRSRRVQPYGEVEMERCLRRLTLEDD